LVDADRWVDCSCHGRHWGAYGAAGLLLLDGDGRVLLQQRAPASQHGGTWGIPGGAKAAGEADSACALREAVEEVAGLDPAHVALVDSYVVRHGTAWSYSTFVGRVAGTPAVSAGAETVGVAWVGVADVGGYVLHPGFATAWRDGLRAKVEAQSNRLLIEGWRCFALDDEDQLHPPFMLRYRPENSEPLAGRQSAARCIEHDHPAPAPGCTCGARATVDLSALLEAVAGRTFTGSMLPILAECGVLARVRLLGEVLLGVDIPTDDPPTTWRAAGMELLELHLAPALGGRADGLVARYGVPVAAYDAEEWPSAVNALDATAAFQPPAEDVDGFRAAIARVGFGRKDTSAPAFVKVGRDMCATLRAGCSRGDAVRVLFDGPGEPSRAQAEGFVAAAVEFLCPDCAHAPSAPMFTPGVSSAQDLFRAAKGLLR